MHNVGEAKVSHSDGIGGVRAAPLQVESLGWRWYGDVKEFVNTLQAVVVIQFGALHSSTYLSSIQIVSSRTHGGLEIHMRNKQCSKNIYRANQPVISSQANNRFPYNPIARLKSQSVRHASANNNP